ncbi:MAG: TonB-dependent receptor [Steroidobacteraceae bacterium]
MAAPVVAQTISQQYRLNIPRQPLDSALKDFAQQTGLQIARLSDSGVGRSLVGPIIGEYQARDALNRLLTAQEGLTYKVVNDRTIAILKVGAAMYSNEISSAPVADALEHSQNESQPVSAQLKEFTLEEVMVTARYREESLQKTPISITALSARQIEARGINDIVKIAQFAPNVSMAPGGVRNGKAAVTFIRGVGQFDSSYAYEPGVGMYVDGVYIQTMFGTQFTLGDVESIQILRGPQGTLFGKNTEGGAVVVTNADPKGDNSGYVSAGYGNYNRRQFKGAFDIPLIDNKLFLRAAYGTENQDGYVDLIDYVCAHPGSSGNLKPATWGGSCKIGTEGSVDVQTARAALKWLPTDDLTVRFSVDMLQDRSNGPPDVLADIPDPNNLLDGYNNNIALPNFGIAYDSRFRPPDHYTSYQSSTNPRNGITTPNMSTVDSWGTTLKADWILSNELRLTSISAYRKYKGSSNYNIGQSPLPVSYGLIVNDNHQASEELRLSGTAFDKALEWTIGGYYSYGSNKLGGFYDVAFNNFAFTINDSAPKRSKAGFVHGLYHVTDKLSLEAGARYSDDWKRYTFDHAYIPGNAKVFPVTSNTARSSRIDPKLAVQYQWTTDLMTYIQYGTGYKAGGVNGHPNNSAEITHFDPETLRAYEAGSKSQWLDDRLRINGVVFYNDFKNLQLVVFPQGVVGGIQSNAGHAVIKGAELDAQAEPLRDLLIEMAAGYLDFNYKNLGTAGFDPNIRPAGLRLSDVAAYTPKYKGSMGIQYTANLHGYGLLTPRIDYYYQSRIYFDQRNVEEASQAGYGIFNARLTWSTSDAKWSVSAELNNVFDKFYWLNMSNLSASFGSFGGTPSMPRSFIFNLKRMF